MSGISANRRPSDLIVAFVISFVLLVTSAICGVFIAFPLLIALVLFSGVLIARGFSLRALCHMGWLGAKRSLPVVQVLLLIGMLTAVWIAAGTVPALVYYGTSLLSGRFFILWAFLLTSMVSVLTGTAFGAVGTIGIALMVIARGSDAAIDPVAGAIVAGAFLGDRCSPMSSSAHLVASITRTSLYSNLRNMVVSSLWPIAISVAFYAVLALFYPVTLSASPITAELPAVFNLAPVTLLPAVAMLLLAVLKVDVKLAMLVSIGMGGAIAHTLQHYPFPDIFRFILFGYQLQQDTPLNTILLGGGLFPFAKSTLVVLISTAFAGIFAGSQALSFLDGWLNRARSQRQLTQSTLLVSILANIFGCTQTIAIVLAGQIMDPYYGAIARKNNMQKEQANEQLALDLEDTAVVIAPLVPWNIANLIPSTILAIGPGFIPYAVYLLLLPLFASIRQHSTVNNVSDDIPSDIVAQVTKSASPDETPPLKPTLK